MKKAEYAKMWGIQTDLDWREHFNTNMFVGTGPVAITSCVDCDEILEYPNTINHVCVKIQKRINTVLGHTCGAGTPWRECDQCVAIYEDFSKSNLVRAIQKRRQGD